MNKDLIEITAEIKAETNKAYLVTEGDEEVWIPKSQMCNVRFEKNLISFDISEWLAIKKGFI